MRPSRYSFSHTSLAFLSHFSHICSQFPQEGAGHQDTLGRGLHGEPGFAAEPQILNSSLDGSALEGMETTAVTEGEAAA